MRSERLTVQVTVTATEPPGVELGGVGVDAELGAGDVVRAERGGGGLLRHGRGGGGALGDRRGPCGLGGGAVDVEPRAGQAAEGDDEEQQQDEQRGEQHQLGGDAARSRPAAVDRREAKRHGAGPGRRRPRSARTATGFDRQGEQAEDALGVTGHRHRGDRGGARRGDVGVDEHAGPSWSRTL